MSKRFLGMIKMRTTGDKKVWVSATLELAASLVLMLCGRNRRKRMNKGLCETLTSKQCSFRALHGQVPYGTEREAFSYPLYSVKAQSSQQCSERCGQRTRAWMEYLRVGTASVWFSAVSPGVSGTVPHLQHALNVYFWMNSRTWVVLLTCGLWETGLIWMSGDESWGSAWVGGGLHLQDGSLNASVVPPVNIVKLGSSDYIYNIEKLQTI